MIDPATLLDRLERSLHSLNERRAIYGLDAPTSLILEIEDHEQAITLTRQLADHRLTEAQWREALRPLLVSIQERGAAERIFLQKVGGGYRFIHRLLLEHFAAMEGLEIDN